MIKLTIEEVITALQKTNVEKEKQQNIVNYLNKVVEQERIEKQENAQPKSKNEFGVIIYSNDGKLDGLELTASVYTIKEGEDHGLVLGKISQAAKEQTAAAKRKRFNIESIGAACQNLKRKFLKDKNVNIKTKNPVRVIISNNGLV